MSLFAQYTKLRRMPSSGQHGLGAGHGAPEESRSYKWSLAYLYSCATCSPQVNRAGDSFNAALDGFKL